MTRRRYYAVSNHCDAADAVSLTNKQYAVRFTSRKMRDEWVANRKALSAKACSAIIAKHVGVELAVDEVDGDLILRLLRQQGHSLFVPIPAVFDSNHDEFT